MMITIVMVMVMMVKDNDDEENPGRTSSSLCTVGLPTPSHSKPVEAGMRKATSMAANHFYSSLSIKNLLLLLCVLLQSSSGLFWQSSGHSLRGQCPQFPPFLPTFSQNSARSPKILLWSKYCSIKCLDTDVIAPPVDQSWKMKTLLLDSNLDFWLDSWYHIHILGKNYAATYI